MTLRLEAQKLKGDDTGRERPVPMNDPAEVAVYHANGKPLHRAPHRVRSARRRSRSWWPGRPRVR